MKRNLEIDRLRSLSAFAILICHLLFVFYPEIIATGNYNGFAVTIIDVFFVISGFAISCVLYNQIDLYKSDKPRLITHLKVFAVKRFFRIYPSLYTGVFIIFLLSLVLNKTGIFSSTYNNLQATLMLLTSSYNFYFMDRFDSLAFTPFWTYTIEEQFYIFFPVFLLLTRDTKQRVKLLLGTLVLLTFVIRPLSLYQYGIIALFFTQSHLDAIIYGCLIYIMSQQSWFNDIKPQAAHYSLLRITFILLSFYIIIGLTTLNYSPAIFLPINCFFSSALVLAAVFEKNIIAFPQPINKLLDVVAPRTISIYICHFPVFLLVEEIATSYLNLSHQLQLEKALVSVFFVALTSELVYRFILLPAMMKGIRIGNAIKASGEIKHTEESPASLPILDYEPNPQST